MEYRFRPLLLGSLAVSAVFFAATLSAPYLRGQGQAPAAQHPLPWAYAVVDAPPPGPPAPVTDDTPKHIPDSNEAFSPKRMNDNSQVFDWFPNDHPPMPEIVKHRRSPNLNPWIGSCAWCHLPNGQGRAENAPLAGLPAGYILEQLSDFANGARKTGDPGKRNTATMAGNAGGLTPQEALDAANYFSSIKYKQWMKVVETDTVPKYHNVSGFFYGADEGNEKQPIGNQLLEMPLNVELEEAYHDPHITWTVYVPPGTLKKGEELVLRGGNGKTVACAACHGEGLKGNGNLPPLAGRSPSYLGRQLYDMKSYTRNGPGAMLMRPIVQNLTQDDIMAITAYIASLEP